MSTGTINLTFDTPDVNLVGMGEFDVSDIFKQLFNNNPSIREEISSKITEIFQNISAKNIASDWVEKIKKSLKIADKTIDLKTTIENKIQEQLKALRLDLGEPAKASISKRTGDLGKITEAPYFTKFLKAFDTPYFTKFLKAFDTPYFEKFLKAFSNQPTNFLKAVGQSTNTTPVKSNNVIESKELNNQLSIFLKTINEKIISSTPYQTDTAFEQDITVIVTDFTDQALDKISLIFGGKFKESQSTSKTKKTEDIETSKKGFFGNTLDKILTGLGLSTLPAILKGLTGVGLLAGGLVWLAVDGIRGWLKSDEWGVSKISGAIGGALGGLDMGMSGALKNAGKGALIGGGIGTLIGGPVGLIVGALIGAALGGILGYIGGEALAKEFDKIGGSISAWFKKDLLPMFKDWGKWFEETLMPALSGLWDGLKILGPPLGLLLKWTLKIGGWIVGPLVEGLVVGTELLIRGFVVFGEWLGEFWLKCINWFASIKEKFTTFGTALGVGASLIVDWIVEKWNTTIDFFKTGFNKITTFFKNMPTIIYDWIVGIWDGTLTALKGSFIKLFDWFGDLGKMIKDKIVSWVPDWMMKKDKKEEIPINPVSNKTRWLNGKKVTQDEFEKATKVQPTQALIISKTEPKITFQPDKEDKMYSMGDQTVFTKKDDMLGKTFEDIKKQLTNLNTMTINTIGILNEHTKLFSDMLNIDKQQLGILPSLVPVLEKNEKQFPNMSDIRDPAYEYRSKVYDRMRMGV